MAKHFKKNNNTKNVLKFILFIFLSLCIIYLFHILYKKDKLGSSIESSSSDSLQNISNIVIENTNENIKKNKLVEGTDSLEVTGLHIECTSGFSTVNTKIKNISSTLQSNISIEIVILDKDGNIIANIENVPFSLEPNEEYESNSIISLDIKDGYDYVVKLI